MRSTFMGQQALKLCLVVFVGHHDFLLVISKSKQIVRSRRSITRPLGGVDPGFPEWHDKGAPQIRSAAPLTIYTRRFARRSVERRAHHHLADQQPRRAV